MNDSETYIANQIRLSVWSGLTSPEDVQNEVSDILEADADETMLRGFVVEEFARKAEEEASWPAVTDCDKLDASSVLLRKTVSSPSTMRDGTGAKHLTRA